VVQARYIKLLASSCDQNNFITGHKMVNINIDRNRYKLRWSYKNSRYSLSIGVVSPLTLKAAQAKAKLIESDILFDRFDDTLNRYGKSVIDRDSIVTIWQAYKEANSQRIALTTQKECWSQVDRCLAKLPTKLLALDKADEALAFLLKHYSAGTLRRVLISLNASLPSANYLPLNKLPKTQPTAIACFSDDEIRLIIDAFEENRYQSAYSKYAHDYYANYVRFLAYTGCRPEEAIALTSFDVDFKIIRINKAYSKGILKTTKTNKAREFPINEQLRACCGSTGLLFPSVSGGYINHNVWSARYWRPVVRGLVADKLISQYLKPYCLRHSFITRCIKQNLDVATVAQLAGTSSEMIFRHYLSASTDVSLPEL
jgi:integrase